MITQIIPEDDAIYQCMAESEQGSVLSLARLIVVMSEDRPSAPRNIHAETISSSAILLAWERPLYNADKVIAYSIHYMKAEGETQKIQFILFQVFHLSLKTLVVNWEGVKRSRMTGNHNTLSHSLTCDQLSLVKAICCCCTEQRSRRTPNGTFTEITTGLASPLSAPQLILLAVKGTGYLFKSLTVLQTSRIRKYLTFTITLTVK